MDIIDIPIANYLRLRRLLLLRFFFLLCSVDFVLPDVLAAVVLAAVVLAGVALVDGVLP